jgi:sterol desaturase/sphingolipid hydroxylase (fatty acid hydroxylase superfamily)
MQAVDMFETLTRAVESSIGSAQQWLFEAFVQPLVFMAGLMRWQEEAYEATEWFVIGIIEIAILALVLGIAQRRWPAEPLVDRAAVRTDILYTFLHRLGVVPVLLFVLLTPAFDWIESILRFTGFSRFNLETLLPWLEASPLAAFLAYLIVLDFVDYLIHRAQHRWSWWWALHSLHHSQRQMTFWSDDRNHLLDDLIRDAILASVAILIGVAPGQFFALIVVSRMLQSLQHANLRWRYGGVFERLLVSPSFHRRHHAIGFGHEGARFGCNFAVLFPIWDLLGRTADFRAGFVPTGIRDQLDGRDYGCGFWSQQWRALLRWSGRA